MDHWRPHNAVFEGHYAKFLLPSGASIALIVSTVPEAPTKPHMVSFNYVRRNPFEVFQREIWVEKIERIWSKSSKDFELRIPGLGYWKGYADATNEYLIENEEFSFRARTSSQTPWSTRNNTPEGLLVHLPLPLHWHVHSLSSETTFSLNLPSSVATPKSDINGLATVHEEKNWAHSFPKAHIWIQAREGKRGFSCAGGKILGMDAFLLGYRNGHMEIDFKPPFTVQVYGFSPFISTTVDWPNRSFSLNVQSISHKLHIVAKAPLGTFFSLSSPFPEGHRENYLAQSFEASLDIQVYERLWTGGWKHSQSDRFENAALEFGGAFYPPAGTEKRSH
ncbi:hypothetical protein EJ08DRAFT_199653 [Tothia fuscella]|uniref:Uncharacterized protein n=1 Tax=Tothia fuscella TaxID=1048955 RepID=A0A9P4TZN8_9PEZI|nr:hypothetical protein EJ08DRAFT_199653 [Tothia fuscella]